MGDRLSSRKMARRKKKQKSSKKPQSHGKLDIEDTPC